MTPEGRVKAMVRRWLHKHHPGAFYYQPVQCGYGRHGIPDFVCCIDGRFVGLETKAPGGKLSLHQESILEQIDQAGGLGLVVYGEADLRRLEEWLRQAQKI